MNLNKQWPLHQAKSAFVESNAAFHNDFIFNLEMSLWIWDGYDIFIVVKSKDISKSGTGILDSERQERNNCNNWR